MNWKIGDIAICVNTSYVGHSNNNGKNNLDYYPPLRLNAEYVVQNVYECIKCKRISLDVGLSTNHKRGIVCICNHPLLNNGIHWCASERFVKKGLSEEEENSETIEKENYKSKEKIKNFAI